MAPPGGKSGGAGTQNGSGTYPARSAWTSEWKRADADFARCRSSGAAAAPQARTPVKTAPAAINAMNGRMYPLPYLATEDNTATAFPGWKLCQAGGGGEPNAAALQHLPA